MMIQANFKELREERRPKREDSDDREERNKGRQRDDKGSTNDAKSLKPDVLDTSMPQLTIKIGSNVLIIIAT